MYALVYQLPQEWGVCQLHISNYLLTVSGLVLNVSLLLTTFLYVLAMFSLFFTRGMICFCKMRTVFYHFIHQIFRSSCLFLGGRKPESPPKNTT